MPQGKQAICISLFAALFALLSGCSVSVRPFFDASEISDQEMPAQEMPAQETSAAIAQNTAMTHATYDLPQATVHIVKINPDAATFSIALANQLETVEAIARQQNAAAAINAGFFDPQNGKTTSYLFSEGQLIGDPANNERLMENLDLQQYLPSILNRSEFRHYRCSQPDGEFDEYAIARRSDLAPPGCQLHSAIGGGPQLLPTDTSAAEAFTDTQNGELIRDAIGSIGANARSAIGIINSTEEIVLIMAAQREDAPGFTLKEMTDFSETLGVTSLLNLDGGSSSSLYYSDQTYLAKQDAEGNPIERPVKSVIVFK
ncbi:MAG: phosphodiester glycosidase family protein [Cyanobacteria bacterium J06621_3]